MVVMIINKSKQFNLGRAKERDTRRRKKKGDFEREEIGLDMIILSYNIRIPTQLQQKKYKDCG